jgi:hypothetical protein
MKHMHPLRDAQELWARIEKAVPALGSATTSSIRKQWRRSWVRKVASSFIPEKSAPASHQKPQWTFAQS